jgi:hypothetical protein
MFSEFRKSVFMEMQSFGRSRRGEFPLQLEQTLQAIHLEDIRLAVRNILGQDIGSGVIGACYSVFFPVESKRCF